MSDKNPVKTDILLGAENVLATVLQHLLLVKQGVDLCGDSTGPGVIIANENYKNAYIHAANRGAKIRHITEITKDNIFYCKEFMKFSEVRHLDGVVGSFGIADSRYYVGIATQASESMPVQAIYSSMKAFVEQQHYFFETLWNRAIPADQKIREIEEGIVPAFIETFDDPKEIENLEMRIVNSSEEEILIIFSTANTFHRHACSGIIKLLLFKKDGMVEIKEEQAIANMISFPSQRSSNLKIRIMTPTDSMIDDTILKLREKYQENIEIQFIQHSSENTASILVVDKKLSLSVEIKDDTQQISNDLAIGLATYSNSKSTVLSYASMFEGFWREAEIYEKLKESRIQLNDAKTEIDNMKEYLNEVLDELHGKQ